MSTEANKYRGNPTCRYDKGPWELFDGKSSGEGRYQFLLRKDPAAKGILSNDLAITGISLGTIHETTEKFEEWTPNARLIAASPNIADALLSVKAHGIPWQHNFGSTATENELRTFACAIVAWWNHTALPALDLAGVEWEKRP